MGTVLGQGVVDDYISKGNEYYKQKRYDKAIDEYDKALQINPNNTTAKFNMANALYKQAKQTEAIRVYSDITNTAREASFRSKNFYNTGVVYSRQKKLEESIEEYKSALRLNPDDQEARENLQKALLELKKNNQQQNQQNQKQKQQQSQSKLNQKQAEQKLDQLEKKEKETQEKVQKSKNKTSGGGKDW
jgi:tetratricopeptide (TPR) repeat protein